MLDVMFQRNASNFGIFLEYEKTFVVFVYFEIILYFFSPIFFISQILKYFAELFHQAQIYISLKSIIWYAAFMQAASFKQNCKLQPSNPFLQMIFMFNLFLKREPQPILFLQFIFSLKKKKKKKKTTRQKP